MCETDEFPTKHIKTLYTYKTDYNADSVEWCPHEPFRNVFVCANYQLKEQPSKNERFGRILLFSISEDNDLELRQNLETVAVLDQKWCHTQIDNCSILGVVNAEKSLEIYSLNPELIQLDLIAWYKFDNKTETLLLSLDWSTCKYPSNEPQIVCSDSNGNIHVFTFKGNNLVKKESWHGHEFEAWIAAFYYWNPNIFFSGGDDCRFLQFDQRLGPETGSCNKSHKAGVTSMHSNKDKEYILVTGSYDSSVRLWDIRNFNKCIHSIKTPGTLWRLKWNPLKSNYLIAACMLGGVHILSSSNFCNLQIIDSYYEHSDIAYGVDWSYLQSNPAIIGSCSFYDNLLCISEVEALE